MVVSGMNNGSNLFAQARLLSQLPDVSNISG